MCARLLFVALESRLGPEAKRFTSENQVGGIHHHPPNEIARLKKLRNASEGFSYDGDQEDREPHRLQEEPRMAPE